MKSFNVWVATNFLKNPQRSTLYHPRLPYGERNTTFSTKVCRNNFLQYWEVVLFRNVPYWSKIQEKYMSIMKISLLEFIFKVYISKDIYLFPILMNGGLLRVLNQPPDTFYVNIKHISIIKVICGVKDQVNYTTFIFLC